MNCTQCGKFDHEDGGCYIDDDVSHEACSECGRSFGDLAEMADTGKCVDCAERPSSEPAAMELEEQTRRAMKLMEENMDDVRQMLGGLRSSSEPAGEVTTLEAEMRKWATQDCGLWKEQPAVTPVNLNARQCCLLVDELDRLRNIARATEADKRTIADRDGEGSREK